VRKLLEGVAKRLKAFLAQRDDLALVVRTPDGESVAILEILGTIEDESTSLLFWKFSEPFGDAEGYAATVVESFAAKHNLVRLLQEKEGMKVWPALPAAIQGVGLPPAERLRQLIVYARSLLPTLEGALVVWVLFPAQVVDRQGYARLMRELLRHEFPFPWCHHVRFILRDDPADPVLGGALEKEPRLAWYQPDLGPQAMAKALEEEAADEMLPLEQRLQSLLLSAGMDYSHKRLPQALEKYQLLFDYYARSGNRPLAAIALNGMGEVQRAKGDKATAGACFEAAMVTATDGPEPNAAIMLTVAYNLATLRAEEKRWADSEGYWDCVQQLAAAERSVELRVSALEQRGEAQAQQGKVPQAVQSWTAAALIAHKLQKPDLGKPAVERLRAHYQKTREAGKLRELEQQLAAVGRSSA
jgi:tetratricopeptide (TPR) repeat protein